MSWCAGSPEQNCSALLHLANVILHTPVVMGDMRWTSYGYHKSTLVIIRLLWRPYSQTDVPKDHSTCIPLCRCCPTMGHDAPHNSCGSYIGRKHGKTYLYSLILFIWACTIYCSVADCELEKGQLYKFDGNSPSESRLDRRIPLVLKLPNMSCKEWVVQ